MSFEYPRQVHLIGQITNFFAHKTNTGYIYEYRFEHSIDGLLSEISICTRNKQIEDEFVEQLFASPKWKLRNLHAFPLKAKVLIKTDSIGFEVFEIEILE